ncbi:response regulator receiver domain-containing protein [Archangium gephyra]|uniref:Response regulator n=1 Tax=Archangium gephyra TaxID=48 RepID=A0AAC8Q027_9BACT|nr:response regulator [Archangium gephyra]AKI98522.1 Response regulator [Archangium gephyra]REG20380.1 response regulator receiver domain-containing protein [Archangium gephyra]
MKTLLVVDDEVGITEALNDLLSEEGFHVLVAGNGREALTRMAEKRPDLILLDYMMPVMDGRELLLALQADAALRHLPVLMMSAVPRSSLPPDCKPTGFLRKPFTIDRLLMEVNRLLGATAKP